MSRCLFPEVIVSHALEEITILAGGTENRSVWAVGGRAQSRLERAGWTVHKLFPVPTSVNGITPSVQKLILAIETLRAKEQIRSIILLHNKLISGVSFRPHSVSVLPIDRDWLRSFGDRTWPTQVLPTFTMDSKELFSALLSLSLLSKANDNPKYAPSCSHGPNSPVNERQHVPLPWMPDKGNQSQPE